MAKLFYITNTSLDGYIEDETGSFDWGNPGPVHAFIAELIAPIGTYLIGRRLYETMSYWDAAEPQSFPAEYRAFARVWRKAEKIVFSRTLDDVPAGYARVERDFDPEAIRKLKRESRHDVTIGGAELAARALQADLVDECHLFLYPVIVGRGKPAFGVALQRNLDLLETRRFDNGAIYARYRVRAR